MKENSLGLVDTPLSKYTLLPHTEAARLAVLSKYQILDTPPEQRFDDITQLAAQICETPIALISLVDNCRLWYKSKIGIDTSETLRDASFCSYAIEQPDVLIVPDTLEDERFVDNPLVVSDPKLRFYAGAPLITVEGYALGTLCVIDYVPHQITLVQKQALQALSRQVIAQLELRRNLLNLSRTIAEHKWTEAQLLRREQETADLLKIKNVERDLVLPGTNLPKAQSFHSQNLALSTRTSAEIQAEIEQLFGFIPPFFGPAASNPQVFENLWQQTRAAYLNTSLSPQFKEKLSAYLSRYCRVSYCLICHSCSLYPLGVQPQEILELLQSPPPTEQEIDSHLQILAAQSNALASLASLSSELEASLLYCSIFIAVENRNQQEQTDYYRNELRFLLGNENYQHLIAFIAYVKMSHVWMEGHPEVSHEGDRRAQNHLNELLKEEPDLASFFQNYVEQVKQEQENHVEQLALMRERKQHEAALQQSEERFRLLVEGVRDYAIIMLDTNGCVASWNAGAEAIKGYQANEILGQPITRFYRKDDFDRDVASYALRLAAETGRFEGEGWRVRKDGSQFWAAVVITALHDDSGRLRGYAKVIRDITDRKLAEEDLRRAHNLLEMRVQERTVELAASNAALQEQIAECQRMEAVLHQEKEFLNTVLENIEDGIVACNAEGVLTLLNRASRDFYQLSQTELAADDWTEHCALYFPDGQTLMSKDDTPLFQALQGQTVRNVKMVIAPQQGRARTVLSSGQPMFDAEGNKLGAVISMHDITDRQQAQRELQKSEANLFALIENTQDAVWSIDSEYRVVTLNSSFREQFLTIFGAELTIGINIIDCLPADQKSLWVHYYSRALQGERFSIDQHYGFDKSIQAIKDVEVSFNPIFTEGGHINGVSVFARDISERKRAEAQLLYDAFHDSLTELPNRALFLERLIHAVERTKRHSDRLFAVLFLDLDHFKVVNDSLGHVAGDQLLIQITHELEACLSFGDTLSRFGGDEFIILLEDIRNTSDALVIAERIHQRLAAAFNLDGQEVFTTASIGITFSTTEYEQPEDLLRYVDIAMYRSKALGRARHEVFDVTMQTQAIARLHLETELRRAIQRQEFELHYQPIVSLKTGKISGFEALLRWQHPLQGMMPPAEFIPIAEETGLIVPIGRWVLREACRQMRAWCIQFPHTLSFTMSVNLSSRQFTQSGLAEQIDQILEETGLAPTNLKLEITESVVMENAKSAARTLLELRNLGVQLAIDDFGTGYSSLSYLHQFPANTLKIDRSFVSRIGDAGENGEIVHTIMTLAHSLNMDVVAEGVETVEQLAQLRLLECEYGQGYLFCKPKDGEMISAVIEANPEW